MNKASILIATPCFGGMIDAVTAGAIYELGLFLEKKNIHSGLYFVQNESYVPSARNRIASVFLASEFSHLMCIDADIGFKAGDVMDLFQMDKEFAAAAYSTKGKDPKKTVKFLKNGEVEAVGAGFMLLRRSVFEKIAPNTEKLKSPTSWEHSEYHNFYGPIIEGGLILAEDFSFCKRWRDVGGKIYLNSQIKLTHYGKFGYTNPAL